MLYLCCWCVAGLRVAEVYMPQVGGVVAFSNDYLPWWYRGGGGEVHI